MVFRFSFLFLFGLLCAGWIRGYPGLIPPFASGWYQFQLGGGGLEVGSDFPSTGVRFIKSDDGGAYVWNTTTGKWSQILCQTCIPANANPGVYNFGYYPTTGSQQVNGGPPPTHDNSGVLGIAGAPSDASVAYIFVNGHVLVSTTVNPANPTAIALIDTGLLYSSPITNATWASTGGGQVTFTIDRIQAGCTSASPGCFFKVEGVVPSGYNGNYRAISVSGASSTSGGTTIIAALASNPGAFSSGGTFRSATSDYGVSNSRYQRALEIDPNNKDHVVVSTQYDGLFETFNGTAGASATWAPFSASIPVTLRGQPGDSGATIIPIIAFDKNSGVTGGNTNTVYVSTPAATAGVYKTTTTTTGTWALMAGSPTTAQSMIVTTATIGQGDVWVTSGTPSQSIGNVWQYNGSWNNRISSCCGGVSVNPFNGNQVVASNPQALYVSTNGGASFTQRLAGITATDSPWQNWMASKIYLSVGSVAFDPVVDGQIWFTGGQGVWYTPTVPAGSFNWVSNVLGIETLIGKAGIAVYAPYKPVFGAQDEAGCQFNVLTQPTPPSSCIPLAASKQLSYFQNFSVPPTDTSFMVGKASFNFGPPDYSGYSTDGFSQSYVPFNTWNTSVTSASNPFTNVAGEIKVTVASTSGLTTWSPGNAGSANSILCTYGLGMTRNPTSAEGALNSGFGYKCFTITVNDATHVTLNRSVYASLGNPLMTSYVLFAPATTLFDEYNGSFHVTAVAASAGKVQVTFANGQFGYFGAGAPVCLSGVVMAGGSVVNGCWIAESVSAPDYSPGTVVLSGSTFVGGDTLVTAGVLKTWSNPGGSIAASTRNNIALAGANGGRLQCSLDQGQTWTTNQPIPYVQTTVTGGPYAAGATAITVVSAAAFSVGSLVTLELDDGSRLMVIPSNISTNTITFSPAIPAGMSVATGRAAYLSVGAGYGFAAYGNLQQLAADQAAANTFYAVNINTGLYRWTNCGTPTLVNANIGNWLANASVNTQVKAVPGENGHLAVTTGHSGGYGTYHPVSSGLWRSCSATQGTVSMERMRGFFEVFSFGFGKAKLGSTYPTWWVIGWYDSGNVQANAVFGVWKSSDDPNHGATGSCNVSAGAQTWTNVGGYPTGWAYTLNSLSGDPYVYGMVYGASDAGWYYGYFP